MIQLVLPTSVVFGVAYQGVFWGCLACVEKLAQLSHCVCILTWGVSLPRIAAG